MENLKPHSPLIREFFFWSGIVATFAYRVIVVLNNYNLLWAQIAWYVGTIGFIIYFIHRYQISEKRAKLIRKYSLDRKVSELSELSTDEKLSLGYILDTLKSTKEKWNSIFIFLASGIALMWGIYLDLLRNI